MTISSDFIGLAERYLAKCRTSMAKNGLADEMLVMRITYLLFLGNSDPEKIGTTRIELLSTAHSKGLKKAKENLRRARSFYEKRKRAVGYTGHDVRRVRLYLARIGLKPEDIGTDDEELQRMTPPTEKPKWE